MDIAKYIGLYLLKNKYCYIHGLGNLELKKRPAAYDGEELSSPSYEVVMTPTGSIDDNLANFIATNEQISISKAANGLREFSTQARADLQAGREVVIPSLGKFIETGSRIQFITDPHINYTPPSIPTVRTAPAAKEQPAIVNTVKEPYNTAPSTGGSIAWGKVMLVCGLLAVIVLVLVFGINYISSRQGEEETASEEVASPVVTPDTIVQAAPVVDTAATVDSNAAVANSGITTQNGMLSFKLVLRTYKDQAAADKRAKQLTSYGNTVEVVAKDSTTYLVLMPVTAAATDTAHVIDSIRRVFNPQGVAIYQ